MIVIERDGERIGTLTLVDDELQPDGPVGDLIEGKRMLGLDDQQIYDFYAAGGLDNAYYRAYEAEDEEADEPTMAADSLPDEGEPEPEE